MPPFTKRKPGLLLAIAAGAATVAACGGSETHANGFYVDPAPDSGTADSGNGCSPHDDCCNHPCGTVPVPPPDAGPTGVVIQPPPDAGPIGVVPLPPHDGGPVGVVIEPPDGGTDAAKPAAGDAATDSAP